METQAFREKMQAILLKQEELWKMVTLKRTEGQQRQATQHDFSVHNALANRTYSSLDLINQRPANIQRRRLYLSIQHNRSVME